MLAPPPPTANFQGFHHLLLIKIIIIMIHNTNLYTGLKHFNLKAVIIRAPVYVIRIFVKKTPWVLVS